MTVYDQYCYRYLLGGVSGSVLDVYGGEYEWDNYTVKLHAQRGQDRGVKILYGKNLKDVTQEENISNALTGIYPYYKADEGTILELPEKVVQIQSTYAYPRIAPVDLSSSFESGTTVTVDMLREAANSYIKNNDIAKPTVSLQVQFEPLWQTEGYEDIAGLERVGLCDTVEVEFYKLGVSAKAKVVKTVFDVLKEKYESIEIGDARTNIADTIVQQQQEIDSAPSMSTLEQAIAAATNAITGNSGGYVVLRPAKNPQEILIMDTPDINTAKKVWRWNSGGLGYSSNGYNGPFALAMTSDGQIVANRITSGILNADIIQAGVIRSADSNVYFDLDSGILSASRLTGAESLGNSYLDLKTGQHGGTDFNFVSGGTIGLSITAGNGNFFLSPHYQPQNPSGVYISASDDQMIFSHNVIGRNLITVTLKDGYMDITGTGIRINGRNVVTE